MSKIAIIATMAIHTNYFMRRDCKSLINCFEINTNDCQNIQDFITIAVVTIVFVGCYCCRIVVNLEASNQTIQNELYSYCWGYSNMTYHHLYSKEHLNLIYSFIDLFT